MLQGVMNQNTKVIVRVEYEQAEEKKVCYGEIDERKVENFQTGEDDFICVENDGSITWLDKESLISIEKLQVKSAMLVKPRITDYFEASNKTDTDVGICL